MDLSAYLFGVLTFLSTLLGGAIALRFSSYLKYLIAFSGGALVALSLIHVIPESLEILEGQEPHFVLGISLGVFVITHFLDKLLNFHGHTHSEECEEQHKVDRKQHIGILPVFGLILHTFLDGLSIGAGFAISFETGILISMIVLLHDFADGINTVTLLLRNQVHKVLVFILLAIGSLAPVLGVLVSSFLNLSETTLGFILAAYAGFFLYLGATDLLPEAHKERSSLKLVAVTILGVAVVTLFSLFHA